MDSVTPDSSHLREELEARLRFESLLADLSSRFISVPSDELDSEIENAQRRVCECLGFDLSSLWQRSAKDPHSLVMTHVCRLLEGPPFPPRMNALETFPWCEEQLVAGKVVAVSSVEDLPREASCDQETWRRFGVKTSLGIPLSTGGELPIGVLSFNTMREEREWPEKIVKRLQLVAEVFSNALSRRCANEALRENEERLDLAADSAGAGLWTLDLATRCFWVTKRTRELFGFSTDEVVTFDRFLSAVHPEDRDLVQDTIRTAVQSKEEGVVDYRIVRPDGRIGWVSSRGRVRRVASGDRGILMGVTLDITEHKRTEEAARNLSGRLIDAHEKERARVARELHDDLTQRLASLAIDAGRVEKLTSASAVREMMNKIREGLVSLSEDVHALSYQMHPSMLEDLGLVAALTAECERFMRQESLPVRVTLREIPGSVPPDAALCLFRVAQEALRNVARHANARAVEVSIRNLGDGLQLVVQDDGDGFDASLVTERPTLGLNNMRERVRLLEGSLDVESTPGQGTIVLAWVPLKRASS